jgi:hypothetical protein
MFISVISSLPIHCPAKQFLTEVARAKANNHAGLPRRQGQGSVMLKTAQTTISSLSLMLTLPIRQTL